MARTKRATWPWHGLTGLILLLIGLAIWYSTSLISYEWRWNRVPQYFAYQAEEPLRADSISRVEKIEPQGSDARVTLVDEDGKQQVLTVAADSLQFSENDDVAEGDVVGATRHWAAGPLAWGLWTTLWISFVSGAFGLFIGLFTGLCRLSKNPTLHDLSTLYVELVRGTPLLVQIVFLYTALAAGGIFRFEDLDLGLFILPGNIQAAIIALGLNEGAYMAEIIRAGIGAVDKGQYEAGKSLGMTFPKLMRRIVLPQAFRVIVPPLGNEFNVMLKNTTLVSVIGVQELLLSTQMVTSATFRVFELYLVVAIYFLALTTLWGFFQRWLEVRFGKSDGQAAAPNRMFGRQAMKLLRGR